MKYTFKRKYAVTLIFKNEDAILILNEFGYDTVLVPLGGKYCTATIRTLLHSQLFNWLFLNRSKVRILSPDRAIDVYCEYVEAVIRQYDITKISDDEILRTILDARDGVSKASTFHMMEQLVCRAGKERASKFKFADSIKKLMKVDG